MAKLKLGQRVQVRHFDGADHWLYAVVEDPATNRVRVTHAGNASDGQAFLAADEEIRTKADVEALIPQVQAIVAKAGRHGLSEPQIRQLGELDGFWLHFCSPADGKLTEHQSRHLSSVQATLHQRVVKHYQEQLKKLA